MSDIKRLKDKIKYDDVFSLLDEFGAEPIDRGSHIEALTICHMGDSHKLYFYKDTNQFMCYTHDGSFDIVSLIEKVQHKTVNESVNFLESRFGSSDNIVGEFVKQGGDDVEDLNPLKNFKTDKKETVDLKVFDKKVLYSFTPLPHYSWIKEGISASSMRKFHISYDIEMNRIIIPHMDINNNLVGIRARNLDEYAVDTFGKYTPIRYKGIDYRYPTGENLYGININKENIKKYKKIILFEAEKSVLFMDTYYDDAFAVAVNGSMLTDTQIGLIASLGVDEVIVAFDKEFEVVNDKESVRYAQKLSSMLDRLKSRYNVSIIWDTEGLLDKKDSPADKGKEVFDRLYNGRIKI